MGLDFDDVKEDAHSADDLNLDALGGNSDLPEFGPEADADIVPTDGLLDMPDGVPTPENRPTPREDEQDMMRRGQDQPLPSFMDEPADEPEELPATPPANFIPANESPDGSGSTGDGSEPGSIYAEEAPYASPPEEEVPYNSDLDLSVPLEGTQPETSETLGQLPKEVPRDGGSGGWLWPIAILLGLALLGYMLWSFLRRLRRAEAASAPGNIPMADPPRGKVDMTKAIDPDTMPAKPEFEMEPVMPEFAETPLAETSLTQEPVEAASDTPEWMQWKKDDAPAVVETPSPAATWEAMDTPVANDTDSTTATDPPLESQVVEAVKPNAVEKVDSSMTSSFTDAMDAPDVSEAAGIASASALGATSDVDRERIRTLESELEESRQKIGQLEQESHQNYATVEGLTRQRDGAVDQANSLQAEIDRLKEEAASAPAPTADVDALTAEREEAIGKAAELEAETASLRAALTAAENSLGEANEKRDQLSSDLAVTETSLDEMKQALAAAHTSTVTDDPEYLEIVSDRDRLASENGDLQRVIGMHEETVGRLNAELDENHAKLAIVEKKFTQSELDLESASNSIADLENEKQTLLASTTDTAELDQLRSQITEHESSFARLSVERDEAITRLSQAAVLRDEMELRIAEYNSRASEYESQVQEVAPLRARIAELESRMHNSGTDVERFESERSDLLEQLQSALQRAASLESTLRETEAEMATIMSDQSDVEPLQSELVSQRERLNVLQQSIEHRDEQLQALQAQYKTAQAELAELRENSESVMSESQSKINSLTAENQKFEESVQWLARERDDARAELVSLQEFHQTTSKKLDELTAELQEIKARYAARAEVAIQVSDEQVSRLSTERDTAIKAWGRAEQRLTDLQSGIRDQELTTQRLENDNERLARHLEELQSYRVQLEKSLQDAEQRLSTSMSERVSSTVGDDGAMAQAELENSKQLLSVVTREKQQVLDWLEQAKQENRQLQDSAAKREQSVKELQHEREALQSILDNRSATADHESRKLSQMRDELRVVREQRDELESSYERVKREKEAAEIRSTLPANSIQHSTHDSLEVVGLDDSGELIDLRNQLKDRDIELGRSQQDLVKLQRKVARLERQMATQEDAKPVRKRSSRQKPPAKRKSVASQAKKAVASRAKQTKSKPRKARKASKVTKKTTTRKKTRRKAK